MVLLSTETFKLVDTPVNREGELRLHTFDDQFSAEQMCYVKEGAGWQGSFMNVTLPTAECHTYDWLAKNKPIQQVHAGADALYPGRAKTVVSPTTDR
jgi:hypothetical protein